MDKQQIKAHLECIIEKLAEIEHSRWAHWQQYVHQNCVKQNDGSLVIPVEFVERWERLIGTKYIDLSEKEKESDRNQVYRYLSIITEALAKD